MHNRLDGILRLLDKNKDFYDGTATECPAILLCELMSEDDPFIPFCESLAIHQVEPQEAQALRKQFDDIGQLSKQVFGRISGRFNLSMDEDDKSNFSKFLTEYSKCSEPKGMTRHEWVWSFAYNNIISWIVFCYTIELNEERCLGKAMEDPKFRVETAEARIARMNLHQRWDRRFRGARPDVRNCIDFFASLLLRVSFLVAGSRNFFDFDTGRGKGSCEEDIDAALTADTRHAPYNKLVPAVASPWIELARTRVISTLAATFHKRAQASKDNPEAHKLWKDLYAMVCPQNDDLKLDYTPEEVSVIVRLAKLAADYSHDCLKAVEKFDNVLPLATIQPTDTPGVDVCDLRPLREHPFKWRGKVVDWFERVKRKVAAKPDSQAIIDLIDRTTFIALEYYRVLSTRAPYLRGETDKLPPPLKDKNGMVFDVGRALTGSVANCLLSTLTKVIENLPALNTPDGDYPFDRLDEMFKAINLFTTMMNHCEEENASAEGDRFGCAVTDTVLLHRLVCPKKNAQGRYVLERDLIAKAYADFYKSMLAAAWSIRLKAEKREKNTIELGELKHEIEEMRERSSKCGVRSTKKGEKTLGIGDQGLGDSGLMPKVEDLTRVVKEGFEEIKGEFAAAHKEHQKIDKEVVGTRRGLGTVHRHITDWKNIVREMLSKRKIPWGKVEKAVGEDRYGKVDWSKIKHKDGLQQIKDVIDYTYDVKPVTLGVSKKNLKATGGITLADACKQTAILHAEEWAKFTDPYPKGKGLYVACYDLATRKREANPFKTV